MWIRRSAFIFAFAAAVVLIADVMHPTRSGPVAVLTLCVWPVFALVITRKPDQITHRLNNGFCPMCGYDLRATPKQCPECGRMRTQNE